MSSGNDVGAAVLGLGLIGACALCAGIGLLGTETTQPDGTTTYALKPGVGPVLVDILLAIVAIGVLALAAWAAVCIYTWFNPPRKLTPPDFKLTYREDALKNLNLGAARPISPPLQPVKPETPHFTPQRVRSSDDYAREREESERRAFNLHLLVKTLQTSGNMSEYEALRWRGPHEEPYKGHWRPQNTRGYYGPDNSDQLNG